MAIRDRRFTYRGSIRLSSSDLALARAGRKTCTIRIGRASVVKEMLDLTDGRSTVRVRIESVDSRRVFRELNELDVQAEGFTSRKELEDDLRQYYGEIDPEQPVTVIIFQVAEGQVAIEPGAQGTLWDQSS